MTVEWIAQEQHFVLVGARHGDVPKVRLIAADAVGRKHVESTWTAVKIFYHFVKTAYVYLGALSPR